MRGRRFELPNPLRDKLLKLARLVADGFDHFATPAQSSCILRVFKWLFLPYIPLYGCGTCREEALNYYKEAFFVFFMGSELEDMKSKFREFIRERDWKKFHNPKDLAVALSVEASELLELFQWKTPAESFELVKEKRQEVGSEVADIMHFLIAFSNATGIDIHEEFLKKLESNQKRYPKELVRGKAHKYTFYADKK